MFNWWHFRASTATYLPGRLTADELNPQPLPPGPPDPGQQLRGSFVIR